MTLTVAKFCTQLGINRSFTMHQELRQSDF